MLNTKTIQTQSYGTNYKSEERWFSALGKIKIARAIHKAKYAQVWNNHKMPEDEQIILIETSRPQPALPQPTLRANAPTKRDLLMVVPASLLFINIVSSCYFIHTMKSFKQYLKKMQLTIKCALLMFDCMLVIYY